MLRLALPLAVALCAASPSAAAQAAPHLCVLPVKAGPHHAWGRPDLVEGARMVPGTPLPVIYGSAVPPGGRPGVWTVGRDRVFTKMPGTSPEGGFPASNLGDRYYRNLRTGAILGANNKGFFIARPGDTTYQPLLVSDDTMRPVSRRQAAVYVERFGTFVLVDKSGMYLVRDDARLEPINPPLVAQEGYPYLTDLPEAGALFFADKHTAVIRYDDGEVHTLVDFRTSVTFDPSQPDSKHEAIKSVMVTPDGAFLRIETSQGDQILRPLRRKARPGGTAHSNWPPPLPSVAREEIDKESPPWVGRYAYRLRSSGVGKDIVRSERGLFEITPAGPVAIPLPFDLRDESIEALGDMPASGIVVVMTKRSVYALDKDNRLSPVRGGERLGAPPLNQFIGVIPVRNEAMIRGERGVHLIVDQRISGGSPCDEVPRHDIPEADICFSRVGPWDDATTGHFEILGGMPGSGHPLLGSQNGPVYEVLDDGGLKTLWEGKRVYARSMHAYPGAPDKAIIIGGKENFVIDREGGIAPLPELPRSASSEEGVKASLPRNTFVYEARKVNSTDPTTFVATSHGLYVARGGRTAEPVPGSPSTPFKDIAGIPGTTRIVAGGYDGLFEYVGGRLEPFAGAQSAGHVLDVTMANGMLFVTAVNGTYTIGADGALKEVPQFRPGMPFSFPQDLPFLKQPFVKGKGKIYEHGTLYRLSRGDGTCESKDAQH